MENELFIWRYVRYGTFWFSHLIVIPIQRKWQWLDVVSPKAMIVHVQGNWFCLLYGSDGQVPNCPTDELSFSSRTGPNQMSLTWRHLHQFCKLTLFQCSMVWRNPREVHFGILKQASRSEYVFFIEKSYLKWVHTLILSDDCTTPQNFSLVHRVGLVLGLCCIFPEKWTDLV